ncbi:MAG: DUF5009 domain-containing protein [Melioribacteraceae bacterium]|nr:DUF5009 domain-containing protein [Melioribacteraceae bacterium]
MKSKEKTSRAFALDALRGIAIIGMILSGSIPHGGLLPNWMYHAQVPPPNHIFNPNLPGITWVDLVFPFFLFAMGAAFPLALNGKLEKGIVKWKLSLHSIQRGLLLAVFAIYIQHIKPWSINSNPTTLTWIISIVGFLLLFPMLLRLSDSYSNSFKRIVKIGGYVGGILILVIFELINEKGFSLYRSDIIILVLANVAVFGSIIWLYTKDNLLLRLGILGIILALRLSHSADGSFTQIIWDFSPFPWLYKLYYMQYLFIVIPGTVIGDLIHKWKKESKSEYSQNTIYKPYISVLLLFGFIVVNLYGLFTRSVNVTLILNVILVLSGLQLFKGSTTATDKLYNSLFKWGVYWLILGFFFEAFEGGIKKDHPTLSYYFVTAGLAIYCYMFFSIIIDYLGKGKFVNSIIENGQNPMIAYIAGHTLITPVLALTNLNSLLNYLAINPLLGFLKGVIFTSFVIMFTSYCTKRKLFWRT